MPTLTGTYIRANGDPARGGVLLTPSVAITGPDDVMLSATQRIDLDADGSFEVDLPATDDPEWTPTGWVWQIEERIPGGRTWAFELTGDADISDLAPVDVPDSYLPWEISATATTGLPGTDADVEVTGTAPQLTFEFTVPRGDKGDTGDPGPTTDLSIGTVTTLPPGSQATADIAGTPPTLTLDLGLPEGDQGDTGPANELTIGTVTTLPPGSQATAGITGTPPSQKLDLGIPQGAAGSPLSTIDAKGDLLVGTANDTVGRLPVGAAGTLLVPDAAASGGLAWKSLTDADVARRSQVGNLLTANQASGGEALANTTGFNGWNCTLAYDAGSGAVVGTKTAAGAGAIRIAAANRPYITPGKTYTFWVDAEVLTLDQYMTAVVIFENEAGTAQGGSLTLFGSVTSGRRKAYVTGIAPPDAARASFYLYGYGNGTFAWHGAGVWEGVGGVSGPPGVPIVGQQPQNSVVVTSITQNWTPAQPVHVVEQTGTVSLPPSSTVPGAIATIINDGPGVVTISRTAASDTIAGSLTTVAMPGRGTLRLAAHGPTNTWRVLEGQYSTDTVGLATYQWRAVGTPGWRLVAYDSGVRQTTSWDAAGTITGSALPSGWVPRTGQPGYLRWHRTTDMAHVHIAHIQTSSATPDPIVCPTGFLSIHNVQWLVPMATTSSVRAWSVQLEGLGRAPAGLFVVGDATGVLTLSWPSSRAALPPSLPGAEITAPV